MAAVAVLRLARPTRAFASRVGDVQTALGSFGFWVEGYHRLNFLLFAFVLASGRCCFGALFPPKLTDNHPCFQHVPPVSSFGIPAFFLVSLLPVLLFTIADGGLDCPHGCFPGGLSFRKLGEIGPGPTALLRHISHLASHISPFALAPAFFGFEYATVFVLFLETAYTDSWTRLLFARRHDSPFSWYQHAYFLRFLSCTIQTVIGFIILYPCLWGLRCIIYM